MALVLGLSLLLLTTYVLLIFEVLFLSVRTPLVQEISSRLCSSSKSSLEGSDSLESLNLLNYFCCQNNFNKLAPETRLETF